MSRGEVLKRKLAAFRRLGAADRLILAEAVLMLALARLVVVSVPFRLMAPWLSRAPDAGAGDNTVLLRRVRQAVMTAAPNVPWNAVCLPQALAVKAMLARRGCGSSVHFGVSHDPEGKLVAHAWLTVGDTVVVGAAGMAGMTPLARFG